MDTVLYQVWAAITKQLHHNSNKMWAVMCIHGEWLGASTTNAVAWIQAAHINQIDNWEAISWPVTLGFFLRRLGRSPSIKMKGKKTTTVQPWKWLCNKLPRVATRTEAEEEEEEDRGGHVLNKQWHTEVTVKQFFSTWWPPVCCEDEQSSTFIWGSYGFMLFICSVKPVICDGLLKKANHKQKPLCLHLTCTIHYSAGLNQSGYCWVVKYINHLHSFSISRSSVVLLHATKGIIHVLSFKASFHHLSYSTTCWIS